MSTDAASVERVSQAREARIAHISDTLVGARETCTILPGFPGELPHDLDEAYAVQDRSIGLWKDDVVAWKVGGIPPELRPVLGQDWVTGPIYRKRQQMVRTEPVKRIRLRRSVALPSADQLVLAAMFSTADTMGCVTFGWTNAALPFSGGRRFGKL